MRKLILLAVAGLAGAGCGPAIGADTPTLDVSTPNAVSTFAVSETLTMVSDAPVGGQYSSTGLGAGGQTEWMVVARPGKAIPSFSTDQTGDYEFHITVFECRGASRCRPPRDAHNSIADCFASFHWDGDASAAIVVELRPSGRCSLRSRGPVKPPIV
jgi:hypothetical protein